MSESKSVTVTGLVEAKAFVLGLADKLPKMVFWATSDAAVIAKDTVSTALPTIFDRPTPFIKGSLRVATDKDTKEVRVAMKDFYERNLKDPIPRVLNPQIEGTGREHKPMEKQLIRGGFMTAGEYLVPSRSAPLDAYGNISGPTVQKMLADIGAYTTAGSPGTTTKRKAQYVWGKVKGTRGIYQVQGGVARQATGRWRLIMLVVKRQPQYRERFPFYKMVRESFDASFPGEFTRIWNREVAKL